MAYIPLDGSVPESFFEEKRHLAGLFVTTLNKNYINVEI
jgi:hypothetical protein